MLLGIVGHRGPVGRTLWERIKDAGPWDPFRVVFFSVSNPGGMAPSGGEEEFLWDAMDLGALSTMDVIISCQGSSYTQEIYPSLRKAHWGGYWIDAASWLRFHPEAFLILPPINEQGIKEALMGGGKTFVGPNCTVSLLLLAIGGPLKEGMIEWVSTMTYQAASGAGARGVEELREGMMALVQGEDPSCIHFPTPLAGGLIPWIGEGAMGGRTNEELKLAQESQKILDKDVPIDGTCVRVGTFRCHAQALTMKLASPYSLQEVATSIEGTSPWTQLVPNTPEASYELNPLMVSGSLDVRLGRLRPLGLGGSRYLNAFTVGDQLLWGASEPLRQMLEFLL